MSDLVDAATAVTELVAAYGLTRDELADLMGGTVDGGPNGNGDYPITLANGAALLAPCPRKIALLSGDVTEATAALSPIVAAAVAARNQAATSAEAAMLAAGHAQDVLSDPSVAIVGNDLRLVGASKIATVAASVPAIAAVAGDLPAIREAPAAAEQARLSALKFDTVFGAAPDNDRNYAADPTGAKPYGVGADGAFRVGFLRSPRAAVRALLSGRLSVIGKLDDVVGEILPGSSKDPCYTADPVGSIASAHASDGAFVATVFRAVRASFRQLASGSITLRDKMDANVASFIGQGGNDRVVTADANGSVASATASDGTFIAAVMRTVRLTARSLDVGGIVFRDKMGTAGGALLAGAARVPLFVADTTGAIPLQVRPDGGLDLPLPQASRWAGGRLGVGAGYIVERRTRVSGLHDIWALDTATGKQIRLTNDLGDTADYLDPQIVPASNVNPNPMCICIKRVAGRLSKIGLPLTGSGIEVPMKSNPSILFNGDSFLNNGMAAAVIAGLTTPTAYFVTNSGGSYLTAALARLAGGTIPLAEAGSNPTAAGGVVNGSAVTYPGLPQYLDRTYVHIEGGYEDQVASSDPAVAMAPVIAKFRELRALLTPVFRNMVIMQRGFDRGLTPAQVAAQLAQDALVEAAFPAEYCRTYEYMRANGTGSTIGTNGGEVWPANTNGDTLHPAPGAGGVGIYAARAADFINAKGH